MMDVETTNTYIGVTAGLLAVLLVLTLILAAFVWVKSKQTFRGNIRRKRPRLKINIKDVPRTKAQPPSAAYQILSTTDPPEFTIPPTPTIATPATPDSPTTPRRLFHSSHTSLTSPTTPDSPRAQHPSYRCNSPLASPNSQRKQTLPTQRISITSLSAPGSSPNSPRDRSDSSQRPSVVSISAPDSPRTQHPSYRSTMGSVSSPNSPRRQNPPPQRISLSSSEPTSPREQSQPSQRPSSPAPQPKRLRPPYNRSSSSSPPFIKVTSFAETPLQPSSSSPVTTPHNPTNSMPADLLYRRSASVPSEAFFSRDMGGLQDVDSSNLWRSAISKTVAANLLSRPLRTNKKSLYPTNGIIKFCLKYNLFDMELFIKVLDLIDLPLTREKGVSYPYVQVFILTDDGSQKPLFYEVLNYTRERTCNVTGLSIDKIRASVLKFVVMDYDKFSRTEFVADIQLPLEYVNLEGEEETRPLSIINEEVPKENGELLVSLCYQPNSSQVSVIVLKANALPEGPSGSRPDFFVKITLLRNGVITDKRRTKVIKKSQCPVFNEKLVFPVDEHGLRSICLVFDMIHHESRLKQEKKGNVVIGNSYSQRAISPLELKHFHEMLESPQKQIAEWHKIV